MLRLRPRPLTRLRLLAALAIVALIAGCTREAPAPAINPEDLEAVAAAHLRCPREQLRRTDGERQLHLAQFEGCGRQGVYRWSRGEVPLSGPKGWSPTPLGPGPTDASR